MGEIVTVYMCTSEYIYVYVLKEENQVTEKEQHRYNGDTALHFWLLIPVGLEVNAIAATQ